MVLESTVICIDNSEYMRNGDYLPTRIQAQQDAANLVCRTKLRANPENTVALLTLSDVKVHVTSTMDSGKLLSKLHLVQPQGTIKFINSVRVAQLALKHRQGKNHRMKIVVFVGSPIEENEKDIIKLAKKLKKEKVNVEVVNFGEEKLNTEKLTAFVETLNGKEGTGSHLVNIPPGSMLSDALVNSPICAGEGGAAPMGNSGGFDFDPNNDPELALALRVSLEEQRHRQEEESRKAGTDQPAQETQSAPATAMAVDDANPDDEMLRTALAMSMGQSAPSTAPATRARGFVDISQMSEDEQIAYALQMSVQDEESTPQTPMDTDAQPMDTDYIDEDEEDDDVITDPAFLQSVLQNLPGVDASSEAVQQAMNQLAGQRPPEEKEEDKEEKKK